MKKTNNNLIDWDDHLDNKYGKLGTASRDKFELEFDWWINISQDEKNAIDEGLEDIKNGNVFTHQQVMEELRSRYGELA